MKQDRFLLAILVGIGLLIVLAIGLFFARRVTLDYGPEDTPAGVVRNYIVALEKKDYTRAYSYLAEDTDKPTVEQFRQSFMLNRLNPDTSSISLGETHTSGEETYVDLNQSNNSGDPFGGQYRSTENALLRQQNGAWKIRQMPYPYFMYEWYQPQVKQP